MGELYLYFMTGLIGLCIGSFLNVLIHRLPRKEKFFLDRSACPKCGNQIKSYDNIPLISFLILGGKCRKCKSKISMRYPLVELLNASAYLFLAWHFHFGFEFFTFAYLTSALIVIFFIDLEHMIIPDIITLTGIPIGLAISFMPGAIGIIDSAIGLLAGGGSLYLVAVLGEKLFKKESMGGGDIKMAAMLGAFLGWKSIIIIFFGSALIGMIISIIMMAFSSKLRTTRMIPFGPFIAIAAVIAMLFGESIINYYLHNFLHI